MTNVIETAKEKLVRASWWGGAGQALPERYVDELIDEIDRLNKAVEQLRQTNGALTSRVEALQSGQHADPVKMNLQAEVQRLTRVNAELENKSGNLSKAIDWALGKDTEHDVEFSPPPENGSRFWWRTPLRKMQQSALGLEKGNV